MSFFKEIFFHGLNNKIIGRDRMHEMPYLNAAKSKMFRFDWAPNLLTTNQDDHINITIIAAK